MTLVRDRLYINNELYIVPEENYINEMEEDAFEIGQENKSIVCNEIETSVGNVNFKYDFNISQVLVDRSLPPFS